MLELSGIIRSEIGHNETLRKQGKIPCVLYGHKIKNIHLAVNAVDLAKIYQEAGGNTLIKLKISQDDKSEMEERVVLIHETAREPLRNNLIHVDFYQVKMDEEITAEIPLVFVGKSEAVEREGGLLVKTLQSIEVEALPANLPHEIQVDISSLDTFDDKITVKDLLLPEGVKIAAEGDDMVASIVPPRTQEELEAMEERPEENVDEIKVEEKGKDKTGEESTSTEEK